MDTQLFLVVSKAEKLQQAVDAGHLDPNTAQQVLHDMLAPFAAAGLPQPSGYGPITTAQLDAMLTKLQTKGGELKDQLDAGQLAPGAAQQGLQQLIGDLFPTPVNPYQAMPARPGDAFAGAQARPSPFDLAAASLGIKTPELWNRLRSGDPQATSAVENALRGRLGPKASSIDLGGIIRSILQRALQHRAHAHASPSVSATQFTKGQIAG